MKTIVEPTRVWINQPSTLQPYHALHGKVGIAIPEKNNEKGVRLCFTEGPVHSMVIPIDVLDKKYT